MLYLIVKRKIFLLSFVYNLNKCLLKYVKYAYDFLERKKVQSLEVYSSSFFKACEGVCAMHNGLREKPVTGLSQT